MNLQTLFKNLNLTLFLNSQDVENFYSQTQSENFDKRFVYFARFGKTYNGHILALEIIRSKNYIVGEKTQIKSCFTLPNEQNEILNSEFFISTHSIEKSLKDFFKQEFLSLRYKPLSIGITGTSGKTSIVQMAGQILNTLNHNKTLKIGTMGIELGNKKCPNSHQTTPDYPAFINALKDAHAESLTHLIMEVSSHGLAEKRVHDYQFDIAVFTNFSQDHLDFHGSMENYFKAKTLLFTDHLKEDGVCIISTQSEQWLEMLEKGAGSKRALYLIVDEKNLAYCLKAQPFISHFKNAYFVILTEKAHSLKGLSGKIKLLDSHQNLISYQPFESKLIGDINFENLMATYAICHACGYFPEEFLPYFTNIKSIPGRMEVLQSTSPNRPIAIIDYSHKPGALKSVLLTLKKLLDPSQKLITVFGCGGDRDASKRPIMGNIAGTLSDITILTSDNPRTENPQNIINEIKSSIPKTSLFYEENDRYLAIQKAFQIAKKSDIILIAGKGHETVQIIGTQKKEFSDTKVAESFLLPG